MSTETKITSSTNFRKELRARGGASASRCYQCATCSSVCKLAPLEAPFPRKQVLWAQWGMEEKLTSDPGIWLCHQCNDCSTRCPRDARPGDVLQVLRALVVEKLATPHFMGVLVGQAKVAWPLLLGVPIIFWAMLMFVATGFEVPEHLHAYEEFVPHKYIYAVYFTVTFLVTIFTIISAWRFWDLLNIGRGVPEEKLSFEKVIRVVREGIQGCITYLPGILYEIASHKRFKKCDGEDSRESRRWGHFMLLWGFVGAAVTSGLLIYAMYGYKFFGDSLPLTGPLPLAQTHVFKILGNFSAVLLIFGGILLVTNRFREDSPAGASTAFDGFFLSVVMLVIISGILTEGLRLLNVQPIVSCWIYILHLGAVLCLFGTFPYSKFAHFFYRTLAMLHEKMYIVSSEPEKKEEEGDSAPEDVSTTEEKKEEETEEKKEEAEEKTEE